MNAADFSHADESSPPPARRNGAAWLWGAALIAVLSLAAYWPALQAGFIWDDDQYLTRNQLVQASDGLSGIWLTNETPQYYPLVFTTYWIEHKLWKLAPLGYHLVNVLLHVANAVLVWRVARRLKIPAAWFIGAVFALHPVHVESVAWITERKNVLSGLFLLLALRAYLRFDETGRRRHYAYAFGLFVAALLSKSVTAMLAPALPFVLLHRHSKLTARKLLPILPLVILGAGVGWNTARLEQSKVGAEGDEFRQTLVQRALIIAPSAYLFYAGKIAWPHPLMFNYPRWEVDTGAAGLYVPLVVVIVALAFAVTAYRWFGCGPLILMLFSAIMLFPALGLLNVFPQRYSFVADHFQYHASLGFIVLYVALLVWIGRRLVPAARARPLGYAAAGAVLLVLAVLTFRQSGSYESRQRLWEDTLKANPDSWFAKTNLGVVYRDLGRYEDAAVLFAQAVENETARPEAYYSWGVTRFRQGRLPEAIELFRKALDANPLYLEAASNLGNALLRAGQVDEAAAVLQSALQHPQNRSRLAMPWRNLGAVRQAQGDLTEAERCYVRAVEINPHDPQFRTAYAKFLIDAERYADAIPVLRTALAVPGPNPDGWLGLMIALIEVGDYRAAALAYNQAIRNGSALLSHHERAAWLLATCPDDSIRNGEEAQRIADRLVEALGRNAPMTYRATFAAVAAENGDFAMAVALMERVLAWSREAQIAELVSAYEERLALYRASKPYRLRPR
ncbi:MAG: tetratricopeptide repeat protein [Planctomycetes bacterium]|nr:tetratricopeptide repeat protein [Planctomycetota bacterium]